MLVKKEDEAKKDVLIWTWREKVDVNGLTKQQKKPAVTVDKMELSRVDDTRCGGGGGGGVSGAGWNEGDVQHTSKAYWAYEKQQTVTNSNTTHKSHINRTPANVTWVKEQ